MGWVFLHHFWWKLIHVVVDGDHLGSGLGWPQCLWNPRQISQGQVVSVSRNFRSVVRVGWPENLRIFIFPILASSQAVPWRWGIFSRSKDPKKQGERGSQHKKHRQTQDDANSMLELARSHWMRRRRPHGGPRDTGNWHTGRPTWHFISGLLTMVRGWSAAHLEPLRLKLKADSFNKSHPGVQWGASHYLVFHKIHQNRIALIRKKSAFQQSGFFDVKLFHRLTFLVFCQIILSMPWSKCESDIIFV